MICHSSSHVNRRNMGRTTSAFCPLWGPACPWTPWLAFKRNQDISTDVNNGMSHGVLVPGLSAPGQRVKGGGGGGGGGHHRGHGGCGNVACRRLVWKSCDPLFLCLFKEALPRSQTKSRCSEQASGGYSAVHASSGRSNSCKKCLLSSSGRSEWLCLRSV